MRAQCGCRTGACGQFLGPEKQRLKSYVCKLDFLGNLFVLIVLFSVSSVICSKDTCNKSKAATNLPIGKSSKITSHILFCFIFQILEGFVILRSYWMLLLMDYTRTNYGLSGAFPFL